MKGVEMFGTTYQRLTDRHLLGYRLSATSSESLEESCA